jgi:hypothetical protein
MARSVIAQDNQVCTRTEVSSIPRILLRLIVGMLAIVHGTAGHTIALARPHPEVYRLAALGAEGPVAIRGRNIDRLFANRTTHHSI